MSRLETYKPDKIEAWLVELEMPLPGAKPKRPTPQQVASEQDGFDAILAMTGGDA